MNAAQSVSVIVPTYNRARYINECIDSLLAQTVPALEILVIDDGSEDDTAQRLSRYGDRIRYVRKENGGKAAAVNLGVELSRGEWLWVLDDDDVAHPAANQARLATLANAPQAGFTYGPHDLGYDGSDGVIRQGKRNDPGIVPPQQFLLEIARSCFFHLGTALVRRTHYEKLGGFDTAMVRGQDYDFQIRLARVARPAFCPESIFLFRQHDGIRGTRVDKHQADERNTVFRKFSNLLGKKVRASLALGEYCVPPSTVDVQADAQRREALINRAQVMGNHGCVDELFDDLMAYADLLSKDQPMTRQERQDIGRAVRIGWSYEAAAQDWHHFTDLVARLRGRPGGSAVARALAGGVLRFATSYPGTRTERLQRLHRSLAVAGMSFL